MQISKQARLFVDFVRKYEGMRLFSTHAEVVDFGGVLYNVDGSSDDPAIDGLNWRNLLRERGIDGEAMSPTSSPRASRHIPISRSAVT